MNYDNNNLYYFVASSGTAYYIIYRTNIQYTYIICAQSQAHILYQRYLYNVDMMNDDGEYHSYYNIILYIV